MYYKYDTVIFKKYTALVFLCLVFTFPILD